MTSVSHYKQQAAERAVEEVRSGMIVGLGHGSTAHFALRRMAALLREGRLHDVLGVPCSSQVVEEARQLGLPLTTLNDHPKVDLTIDGADEIDPALNVIKGGGGALLHEKIVAQASQRLIIIADDSKLSPVLGTRAPVPVEVVPFGWRAQALYVETLGARWALRSTKDGAPFTTDEGHYILDCIFGPISHPAQLAELLQQRAGIAGHGLFIHLASEVIVAGKAGVRVLTGEG